MTFFITGQSPVSLQMQSFPARRKREENCKSGSVLHQSKERRTELTQGIYQMESNQFHLKFTILRLSLHFVLSGDLTLIYFLIEFQRISAVEERNIGIKITQPLIKALFHFLKTS